MRKVSAHVDCNCRIGEAEALWYDQHRWASFIDGFGHVSKLEDGWPDVGGLLVWDPPTGGRGRVIERVKRYEPRVGQISEIEDEQLRGTQEIAFAIRELVGGCTVTLTLEYELKELPFFGPLGDLFFIRRALRDSLGRTLQRFRRELTSDLEDEVVGSAPSRPG